MQRSLHVLKGAATLRATHLARYTRKEASTTAEGRQLETFARAVPDSFKAIDTPFLMVDLDAAERNIHKLRFIMEEHFPGVRVRPHAKAHKSPDMTKLQLRILGESLSPGPCAQKLSEVEALADAGVLDILLSNQIAPTAPKMRRLTALLTRHAAALQLTICVDHEDQIEALSQAQQAAAGALPLGILIEVNGGQNRCGVQTPIAALRLAERVMEAPGLQLKGIQVYHGGLQHVRDPAERALKVQEVVRRAEGTRDLLVKEGLPCGTVTGGGSGSFRSEAGSGVFTEIQPGSFVFGDADYARNRDWAFEQSLWVYTAVISKNKAQSIVVVDAGLKALSLDSGVPKIPLADFGVPVEFRSGGDEHGIVCFPEGVWQAGPQPLPPLGSLLRLQPGHCDPQVNFHRRLVAARGGEVEGAWELASGPGL